MIVEVVGPPLRHMGRLVRAGARVELEDAMARALVSHGRARAVVVPAAEKPTTIAAPLDASRNHQHKRR